MLVRGERSYRVRVASQLCGRNLLGRKVLLGPGKILSRQAGPRQKGLDATAFAAVTLISRVLASRRPWQRIVPPLAANPIKSRQDFPIDDDSSTNTRS